MTSPHKKTETSADPTSNPNDGLSTTTPIMAKLPGEMTMAVLGAGSWGTALTLILARNGVSVHIVGHDPEHVAELESRRENMRFLPGFLLPKEVGFATFEALPSGVDVWVVAVPSHAVRSVVQKLPAGPSTILLASKGLEAHSDQILSDVIQSERPDATVGVLSGPNLAMELARGVPTAAVIAFAQRELAEQWSRPFHCRSFRLFWGTDVIGIEVAGALKNVLAIAAGMSDGLGFGDNTKGALLARGLHEMTLIGQHFGAQRETFYGIAGVGDLFATASSKLSRNYRVGYGLGQGQSLHDILHDLGQVAEGVSTSESVARILRKNQIHAPIHLLVESVIRGQMSPLRAVERLMEQQPRSDGYLD